MGRGVAKLLAAGVCLAAAGCTTAPGADARRVVRMPLASTHADLAFSMTTGPRHGPACRGSDACPAANGQAVAAGFIEQVERVAEALQAGVLTLYPDIMQRVPGLVGQRFDIYVVEGDRPGSASSANGRIALNASLGVAQPYDDWLAFVIAREMGHVIARHHEENSAAGMATSLLMNILLPGSGVVKSLLSAGGSRVASASQEDVQAIEADGIAAQLLKAAGYRLRDVSLSLMMADMPADNSAWSVRFRRSSAMFVAAHQDAQGSSHALAGTVPPALDAQPPRE